MFKRLFTTLCFCLAVTVLWAQRPAYGGGGRRPKAPTISGKISGTLIDSATNQAIPYASVTLFKDGTPKAVNGTLSDEQGRFKMDHKGPGSYQIEATSLGYLPIKLTDITVTLAKPDYDAGKVQVRPEVIQLDAVDITAEAAIVENRIDKIVYNAENDPSIVGGDATELLRKVPLLSVDLEGNVSLRGSSNIQILINGKPSGMFAGSVADALQMISADEIKKVEVITTPTAKYDGEGSGGIINLITKKKSIEGISGSVSAGVGNLRNNGNANVAFAKGRFGLNASGNFRLSIPRDAENNFFRVDTLSDGQLRVLDQTGLTATARNGFSGRFGAFYDFNAYNAITSNFNLRGFTFDRSGELMATFTDPALTLNQLYTQLQDNNSLNSGYDWTTDYIRTFKKPGKEWSVGAQVSGNINNQNIDLTRTGNDPGLFLQERSDNDGDNLELTLQTDYVHPFTKALKLETGVKTIIRRILSQSNYEALDTLTNDFVFDPTRSNDFAYDQDVFAGYASFNINLGKKYSFIAGARYEWTEIAGESQGENDAFSFNYGNLLPSIILSRKLKQFSTLKLSFNQRIRRPSLYFINPFVNAADSRNITVGNPELRPELTDQVELGYTTILKGVTLNASVFYRQTRDVIEQIFSIDEQGRSVGTYLNVGTNQSVGLDVFTSWTIKKIWTLRGGFNLYTYDATGIINGKEVSNTGFLYRANLNSSLALKHGIRIEAFGFFNSPRITLQGTRQAFSIYNLGVKKSLWEKKGSVGLTISQPFPRTRNFGSELNGAGFYQSTDFIIPFRSFGVNFSYRFGKQTFKRRRRSKVRNDDQKAGDSNNF